MRTLRTARNVQERPVRTPYVLGEALDFVRDLRQRRRDAYPNRGEQARQIRSSVWVSLKNNIPLSVASVLCAMVALALMGGSMVVSAGVDNATIRWRGGVETIIFLEPTAPESVAESVGEQLRADRSVKSVVFVSQEEAYSEFSDMFKESPELVSSIGSDALPASWRVIPTESATEEDVELLGARFEGYPGVYQVVYAKDAVASVLRVSSLIRVGLSTLALILGAAAWLLMFAGSRAAAFARREELAVMRLVGAGRMIVRLPFTIEGMLQGALGAVGASGAVWWLSDVIEERVGSGSQIAILKAFTVESSERWTSIWWMLLMGTLLGGAGATLAVGRYARAREGLPANLVHRLASSFTSRARTVRFKYRDKIAKRAFSDGPELSQDA